ncbi:MAG: 50S ribosomal protein L21 [Bacteroidetes bacterium]|nr:50S ribosomal protein L21 [Bacteroidota bacterium]MCL5026285.1 50S ribosomal protein L21 [Chloroflexota bacterium]
MYAVIDTGGKQYKVEIGQRIEVEQLPAAEGETIELDRVLMVVGDEGTIVGQPHVAGAKVVAQVMGHFKDDKVIVFKYKNKTRYRRKLGHRQPLTRLAILGITTAAESAD